MDSMNTHACIDTEGPIETLEHIIDNQITLMYHNVRHH